VNAPNPVVRLTGAEFATITTSLKRMIEHNKNFPIPALEDPDNETLIENYLSAHP
jgi:hypothetical protein